MCGITSPIQPMTPDTETAVAVTSVAAPITTPRTTRTLTPRRLGLIVAQRQARRSAQRSSASGTRPRITSGATVCRSLTLMPDRLPRSQKVMAGSWL